MAKHHTNHRICLERDLIPIIQDLKCSAKHAPASAAISGIKMDHFVAARSPRHVPQNRKLLRRLKRTVLSLMGMGSENPPDQAMAICHPINQLLDYPHDQHQYAICKSRFPLMDAFVRYVLALAIKDQFSASDSVASTSPRAQGRHARGILGE